MAHEATRNRFFISLALGLIISLSTIPWLLLVAPVFGTTAALGLLGIPGALLYIPSIADRPSRGLLPALAMASGLTLVFLSTSSPALLTASIPVALGLARSAGLYRGSGARIIAIELLLGVGGLVVARFLWSGGLVSAALSVWGFMLTQSLYFLIVTSKPHPAAISNDPFEEAHQQAWALLDSRRFP